MIPDEAMIHILWDRYHFPQNKQLHSELVKKTAIVLAQRIKEREPNCQINEPLLSAAALLHDIDKNVEKFAGEQHPDAGIRILKQEGMPEVAEVIRTHPLHMILEDETKPKTIEQELLFLADKMNKYSCIGVDKRFELWKKEDLDPKSIAILTSSYPKVVALKDQYLLRAGLSEKDLILLIQ
jgi:putative nucleotidyltransferase with HDIG domain